jgi:hypothetical protein
MVGVAAREIAVSRFVVLTVIANQNPFDVREFGNETIEAFDLVVASASEYSIGCRPPVGQ